MNSWRILFSLEHFGCSPEILRTTCVLLVGLMILDHSMAQYPCEDLSLVGIYYNNQDTRQMSLVLTNNNQGPIIAPVYTRFRIITNDNDTLLGTCACHGLPSQAGDTIVYNLEISNAYTTIYDLPSEYCAELLTMDPDCSVEYCVSEIEYPDLPQAETLNCNDYKVTGMYQTGSWPGTDMSLLITYTNDSVSGVGPTGYTEFQLVDIDDNELSLSTTPSFILPRFVQDTIIVHLKNIDTTSLRRGVFLRSRNPSCTLPIQGLKTSTLTYVDGFIKEIYPNPAWSSLTVNLRKHTDITHYEIMNISGEVIEVVDVHLRLNEVRIYFQDYNPGLYLLKLFDIQGRVFTTPFIRHQ